MQRSATERKRLLKQEPNFYRHLHCLVESSVQIDDRHQQWNL